MFKKKPSPQQEDELDLKNQRPRAGELRRFPTGEALFFSPLPAPTGATPMDLGGNFLAVNEVFLDVGTSNYNKAFQAQMAVWTVMFIWISCWIVFPLILGLATLGNEFTTFWGNILLGLPVYGLVGLWGGGALGALMTYAVISSTRQKARVRPLRFNRQRREVCYLPEGSDTPIIQPWEDLVAWMSVSTGYTGAAVMSTYTFGLAVDNPVTDRVHFLTHGVLTPAHALGKWEAIRCFMEKGPEHCPGVAPYESRATFDQLRADLHQDYRDGYVSALKVFWFYLANVVTWWKFPYWVAEWDHRYSMKSMPTSVEEWSRPLPAAQWAKPSAELLKQNAALAKSYAQGKNFTDHFNTEFNQAKTAETPFG
ncbi:DUF6708 domain-containing protein [Pseudomonas sp. ATCC 13867]|uniref:DUF6708 domain-containing protein n=1 Tax=Pseudomonas sp. ATCC 13867 TaxID=1294143 RepID=UPI0003459441|nr:DUF6708 domain-containing protein [Pseudomonas sp. ATCC 13867]